MIEAEIGLLVATDESCVLRGRSVPGILTLVWSDGIDEYASDYFRHLHLTGNPEAGSNLEYAKIIRAFLAFARHHNVKAAEMTDAFLITWRDWKSVQPNVEPKRVNDCLRRIFHFLRWLEQTGRIRHVVGVYDPGEARGVPVGYKFPVSARLRLRRDPEGGTVREWSTDLTIGGVGSARSDRHTPVPDEIRSVHSSLLGNRHGVRDALAHSWAEETGARRAELLSINVSQIPSLDELAELMGGDEQYAVRVVRKNQAAGMIYPTLDLLIRTRDYIDLERADVVKKATERIPNYVDPPALFLSGKTAQRLTANALTKISSHSFDEAGVRNASLHRLRARFAQNALEALLDAVFVQEDIPDVSNWTETIITKLMELMGHTSASSLKPYIHFALERRLKSNVTTKLQEAERRLRDVELACEAAAVRLKPFKMLHGIAVALKRSQPAEARRLLNEFEAELVRWAA